MLCKEARTSQFSISAEPTSRTSRPHILVGIRTQFCSPTIIFVHGNKLSRAEEETSRSQTARWQCDHTRCAWSAPSGIAPCLRCNRSSVQRRCGDSRAGVRFFYFSERSVSSSASLRLPAAFAMASAEVHRVATLMCFHGVPEYLCIRSVRELRSSPPPRWCSTRQSERIFSLFFRESFPYLHVLTMSCTLTSRETQETN